jgi:ACR3 family arsenite efflux pump ArsB
VGNIRARLKHELMQAIPPFLYFFAAFQLLAVVRTLMQQEYGIQAGTVMSATSAAGAVSAVLHSTGDQSRTGRAEDAGVVPGPLAWPGKPRVMVQP